MADSIIIKVDEWIIADGNYDHFSIDKKAKFAITIEECSLEAFNSSATQNHKLEHIEGNIYDVQAQVLYWQDGLVVLDTGIFCMYIEGPSNRYKSGRKRVKKGDFVAFKAYFAIDEFEYKDGFHRNEGMLPILYEWQVQNIGAYGKKYPYKVQAGIVKELDIDDKTEWHEKLNSTELRCMNEIDKNWYKSADYFLLEISRTSALPRFTVTRSYHLQALQKKKVKAELYSLILEKRNTCQEVEVIHKFIEGNNHILNFEDPQNDQIRKYQSILEDLFNKIVVDVAYADCLVTDDSKLDEFMPDHTYEEIYYLVKREYGIDLSDMEDKLLLLNICSRLQKASSQSKANSF